MWGRRGAFSSIGSDVSVLWGCAFCDGFKLSEEREGELAIAGEVLLAAVEDVRGARALWSMR